MNSTLETRLRIGREESVSRLQEERRNAILSRGCLLFGAGNNGRQVARQLATLEAAPQVHGFVSDVRDHLGIVVDGVRVFSREEAAEVFGVEIPVVNCVYRADISIARVSSGLRESGFEIVVSLPAFYDAFADELGGFLCFSSADFIQTKADRIVEAFNLLADHASRSTFLRLLDQRLSLNFEHEQTFDRLIYFPAFLDRSRLCAEGHEFTFVDCGAYNGDTLRAFSAWQVRPGDRAIAIEPDPASFSALERAAAQLRQSAGIEIFCINAAAGSHDGTIGFAAMNNESSRVSGDSDQSVRMVTVDSVVSDQGIMPCYVKYDTEGYEMEALAGTCRTIQGGRTSLAVSVYHKPADLWEIPLALKDMMDGYGFHLREHGPDGIDTVLYAVAPRGAR